MSDSALKWLANNAFFDTSRSTIEKYMAWNGMAVDTGQSLCGVLSQSVMLALDVSEPRAMAIINKRVAHLAHNTNVVGDRMILDEVQAHLDASDKQEARNVKSKLEGNAEARSDLLKEFRERGEAFASQEAQNGCLRRVQGPKSHAEGLVSGKSLQKDHKQHTPPDSYLWVDS